MTDTELGHRTRYWIYPSVKRVCYTAPPASVTLGFTIHNSRRRGIPQEP